MVDAVEPLRRGTFSRSQTAPLALPTRTDGASFTFTVIDGNTDALARYTELCADAIHAPAQHPFWVASWLSRRQCDVVFAFIEDHRSPCFALCLEVVREGPFRVGRLLSGSHANGNFFPATTTFLTHCSQGDFKSLFAAIRRARPDIDILALERQADTVRGFANPLQSLPHRESANVALAVDLDGGFDALLSRASGKRKCKKHRSQIRKFEAAGGYRRYRARNKAEVETLLSAYFAMKATRFAAMGVRDVFAGNRVRSFFTTLFTTALAEETPPFFLQGLEIGGKLRAVTGMSRSGDRLICEFGGISEDELTAASPGDFMFFENIKEACGEGFRVFDFSVGDEYYKRLWCDIETRHFDVLVPLTWKGHLAALAWSFASGSKRLVKKSPLAWNLARRVRSVVVKRMSSEG